MNFDSSFRYNEPYHLLNEKELKYFKFDITIS